MYASNSLLGRPKTMETYHIYKLFGLDQFGSFEDHCETIEEFSEEDMWGGVNYDEEAKQAGLQENGFDVVAEYKSVGIKEGNSSNSSPSIKILKKIYGHGENNGTRMRHLSSAPVNIPSLSQMVRKLKKYENFGGHGIVDNKSDDEDDRDFERIPPHELIARQLDQSRITSFSVHEGAGRILKGKDLRQVRNVIWTRTGFLK